jgi:hypothetical protein
LEKTSYVVNFHNLPRFGHTRAIAKFFAAIHSDHDVLDDIFNATKSTQTSSFSGVDNSNFSSIDNKDVSIQAPYSAYFEKNDYNQGVSLNSDIVSTLCLPINAVSPNVKVTCTQCHIFLQFLVLCTPNFFPINELGVT